MDAASWRRVDEIFNAVVGEPASRRREILDEACAGDAELRAEVEALLAHDREDGFLERPVSTEVARAMASEARGRLLGRHLGRYQIVAPLGAGGMGEVYRARDTRLDRSVAIKVMPPHLAADPEARQRFEREARAISALAHPHICALHDVGSADGVDFLVMELVEGETLASRLQRGRVPLAEVLRWAAQIADALAAAHRAGIVHRDLKPGNVMLTRGGAKLLDFGLARRSPTARTGAEQTRVLTDGQPLTAEGTIVGSLNYMAPEQLEGRPADHRADVFAFGAMLYEMVTGVRAFAGESPASVISAILRDQPAPLSKVAPLSPPALDALVTHCLAKDPEERWQDAHDLRLQLLTIAGQEPPRPAPASAPRRWLPWAAAALFAAVAAAAVWQAARPRPAAPPQLLRFELPHPSGEHYYFSPEHSTLALSPDGTTLAFIDGSTGARPNRILLRPLGELTAREVTGTAGAGSLFWSPDGKDLAFVADGKLKRVALAGGAPVVLCDVPTGAGVNGSWGNDGILFSSVDSLAIRRVPAGGGESVDFLRGDEQRGEQRFLWPTFLPDGERFLFVAFLIDGTAELRLAAPGAAPRTVAALASRVEVVSPDLLVFMREGALLAQRLDLERARLVGTPIPLAPTVRGFGTTGMAAFAASRQGTVVVATQNDVHRLALFAADGRPLGTIGDGGTSVGSAVSGDGRRALVDRLRPDLLTYDLWMVDIARQVETRFTQEPGNEIFPVWLPDGSVVYSSSGRSTAPNLTRRTPASERGQWLTPQAPFQIAMAVTPDGRLLFRQRSGAGFELLAVPLAGGPAVPVLPREATVRDAALSPDGELLAYSTRVSHRVEVFVRRLAGGETVRVTRDGGGTPRFSRDGRTLFHVAVDGGLEASTVAAAPEPTLGAATRLFGGGAAWTDFDVLPDGRFLALVREVDGSRSPLTVISGWNAGS